MTPWVTRSILWNSFAMTVRVAPIYLHMQGMWSFEVIKIWSKFYAHNYRKARTLNNTTSPSSSHCSKTISNSRANAMMCLCISVMKKKGNQKVSYWYWKARFVKLKSAKSSWLMHSMSCLEVGVTTAFSWVKSVSKLSTSRLFFYQEMRRY